MPHCELITVGSELLTGSVLNTNAQFLASRISDLNIPVIHQTSCRDEEREIAGALADAFSRADLIILTGGLGPTPDDVTREGVARFFKCGLRFNRSQFRQIQNYFKKIKRMTPFMTRREAFLPDIGKPLLNRFGIALGFYIHLNSRLVIALPGVPRELIHMFDTVVKPLITHLIPCPEPIYTIEAHMAGIYETQVMRKLGKRFFENRSFDFGIYPEIGEVSIRIKTKNKKLISILKRELSDRLHPYIYSVGSETFPERIGALLTRNRFTVAVAESCTGGLLGEKLTQAPGSSQYFKGGVIAYSDEIKINRLNVPKNLIHKHGAVSKAVAREMAKSIRALFGTSFGISITGIAGPSGGSRVKPVGLVYIAISSLNRTQVFRCQFVGERSKIRLQATQKALFYLFQWLKKK